MQSTVLPSSPGTNPSPPELMALAAAITQARLGAGLGVAELAKRLNMGVEQLEALESGDLDRLPEPVFVIAQSRRIAQNLGVTIDGEIQALRQSGSLNSRPVDLQNLKLKAEAEAPRRSEANQARRPGGAISPRSGGIVPVLASLALASGMAAGSFALWQQWQGRVQQEAFKAKEAKQIRDRQALIKRVMTQQAQAAAQTRSQTDVSSLTLSTLKNTWLEVKTLKGKQLFRGDFKGQKIFSLNEGLRVLAGRPDLVVVELGSTAPRPLGTISQVRWQTFPAVKAKPAAPSKPKVTAPTPLPNYSQSTESTNPTQPIAPPKAPAP